VDGCVCQFGGDTINPCVLPVVHQTFFASGDTAAEFSVFEIFVFITIEYSSVCQPVP
jgi:hypothetical protein